MAKDGKEPFYKGINQKQVVNKDGYLKGGVEIKIPEGIPTVNKVGAVSYTHLTLPTTPYV